MSAKTPYSLVKGRCKTCKTVSGVFIFFVVSSTCVYLFSSQVNVRFDRVQGVTVRPFEDISLVKSNTSNYVDGKGATNEISVADHKAHSRITSFFKERFRDSDRSERAFAYSAQTKNVCYTVPNNTWAKGRHFHRALLRWSQMKELGCKKRLPGFLTVGAKKCGTGAFRFFMKKHPQVMFTEAPEIHYFAQKYHKGISWYLRQMPYTTVDQISTEKSPNYFIEADAPRRIFEDISPDVKIVMILCDPINRAVSDFVQVSGILNSRFKKRIAVLSPKYNLHTTFENSVMHSNGTINVHTDLIDISLYVKHIRRWLEYFPLRQILVIDGEVLKRDPYKVVKEVEGFLNLSSYFTEDHFYFDTEKRFFCSRLPVRECMPRGKGRHHPQVDETVLSNLGDFFRPYNEELETLLNKTFLWFKHK